MRGQAIVRSSEKSKPSPSTGPAGSGCCCFSTSVGTAGCRELGSGVGERSFSTGKKPFARHCDGSCASTNSRDGSASRSRPVS